MEIDELINELQELRKELEDINVNTFVLNPRISEIYERMLDIEDMIGGLQEDGNE